MQDQRIESTRRMRDCWARVFADLDTRPVPEEVVATDDGRVAGLIQITDSARWHEALAR